ncbi:hypothetical protein LK542_12465 [Massilia sp. IC2-477]|uniref:hypothetical protein n=1 Tax=Massilia sp. IC2-477 TaxID=2887198 RepID=UPI001D0F6141|nr:hypothetical protein [Massilia sp. IC2-477]MCC2956431.1 hypothetical protein [Massilia sp. IC2-477]
MKKLIIAALLSSAGMAHADDLTFSGFATLTAGKAYSGSQGEYMGNACPCFIGNYEHGAVYNKGNWSWTNESLVGLQAKYQFTDKLSGTVQAVLRASENSKPDVDWAYLSYDLTPETTIQAGRRRLPIYAYSDSVYIGYTLPWARVPQDIYGWEIGAYNGVNIRHSRSVGDWAVTGNVFAGQETTRDNIEQRKIFYGHRVDDDWKNILGGYVDVSNEVFGARLIYMQNSINLGIYEPGEEPVYQKGTRQRIIGLSGSIDYGNWMVRAEANRFMRPSLDYKSKSLTATVGYRYGKFTPMVGFSKYEEKLTPTYTETQNDSTRFVGVRWDFRKNMDLKVQWDSVQDSSAYDFTKNAKMFTVTMDVLF